MAQPRKTSGSGQRRNGVFRQGKVEEFFVVLTVSFTVVTDPLGVMDDGENAQAAPAGRAEQLKLTCLEKPLLGVKATV